MPAIVSTGFSSLWEVASKPSTLGLSPDDLVGVIPWFLAGDGNKTEDQVFQVQGNGAMDSIWRKRRWKGQVRPKASILLLPLLLFLPDLMKNYNE